MASADRPDARSAPLPGRDQGDRDQDAELGFERQQSQHQSAEIATPFEQAKPADDQRCDQKDGLTVDRIDGRCRASQCGHEQGARWHGGCRT
jgi:hypothetical protein